MSVPWCSHIRWMDAALASSILYSSQLTHPTTAALPSPPPPVVCAGQDLHGLLSQQESLRPLHLKRRPMTPCDIT